jgi:response regulator NasT
VKPFRSSEILPKLAAILRPGAEALSDEQVVADDKIETREVVQSAKYKLMAERSWDEATAFEFIQRKAMTGRVRMREVAEAILSGSFSD